jgi:hypothetical protein
LCSLLPGTQDAQQYALNFGFLGPDL